MMRSSFPEASYFIIFVKLAVTCHWRINLVTVVIDVFKWLSKLRSTEASLNIDGIPDQVTKQREQIHSRMALASPPFILLVSIVNLSTSWWSSCHKFIWTKPMPSMSFLKISTNQSEKIPYSREGLMTSTTDNPA